MWRPARRRCLGVVAVDRDLAVANLTQGTGVLACDADGAATLLGEAGVVEDQDAIALGGQAEHVLDALPVEVVLVPVDGRQKALEALLEVPGTTWAMVSQFLLGCSVSNPVR